MRINSLHTKESTKIFHKNKRLIIFVLFEFFFLIMLFFKSLKPFVSNISTLCLWFSPCHFYIYINYSFYKTNSYYLYIGTLIQPISISSKNIVMSKLPQTSNSKNWCVDWKATYVIQFWWIGDKRYCIKKILLVFSFLFDCHLDHRNRHYWGSKHSNCWRLWGICWIHKINTVFYSRLKGCYSRL